MITQLEELSMNAWPALQTLVHDGWVLRFANGYTRRANSVNALYGGRAPLEERVVACEAFYAARGLPTVFKLTPAAQPPELDRYLEARGYVENGRTSVQTATLPVRGAVLGPAGASQIDETLTSEWVELFTRLSGISTRHAATAQRMLDNLVLTRGFATLTVDGQAAACGLGVVEAGYLGLFDIVTAQEQRQRGHGRRLVTDLLAWGRRRGAHTAYLQVMVSNAPALRLYEGVGFAEVYQYWYRAR